MHCIVFYSRTPLVFGILGEDWARSDGSIDWIENYSSMDVSSMRLLLSDRFVTRWRTRDAAAARQSPLPSKSDSSQFPQYFARACLWCLGARMWRVKPPARREKSYRIRV